jgi:hypothetical protein
MMALAAVGCNSQRHAQKTPAVLDVSATEPAAQPAAGRLDPSIPPEYPPEDVDPTPPDEIPADAM